MIAVLPLLICLVTGVLTFLLSRKQKWQEVVSLLGSLSLLVLSVFLFLDFQQTQEPLVMQLGSWQAPFGITFYIDLFSILMIFISAFLALGVNIYSLGATEDWPKRWGFHPLFHFMMMGVIGSFCTSDLFNLYVWFEVLLLGSFGLMALSPGTQAMRSAVKYVSLNLFGSAFFLMGLALLYSSSGTLNFADLIVWSQQTNQGELIPVVGVMLLVAFMMKAGAFPFYQWLPSSYPTVEISALAIFSGLLTKVGIYVIMRFFAGGFPFPAEDLSWVLGLSAGLTMLLGVWGASVQMAGRQILSFHIISQIGYILMGVASLSVAGIAGAIFYLIHHMVVKTNLFLVMGWLHKNYGGDRLLNIGEMAKRHPWLAVGFAIPALSLAGMPPFSGFWAKLLVIQSAVEQSSFWLAGLSLFVGVLTFYSMAKIWNEAFLKKSAVPLQRLSLSPKQKWSMAIPMVLFCLWTIAMGLMPDFFLAQSREAAEALLDSQVMIEKVLGSNGEGL